MSTAPHIIDSKELLMLSLVRFYSQKSNITRIVPIIQGKAPISLRLIDWFITNYSKKHSTITTNTVANNIVHFNVYLSYRSQLKAYSKQLFDPFRRRERITFVYDKNKSIETTTAQLNVFRWLIQNKILDYIEEHLTKIEEDMVQTQKDNDKKKLDTDNMKVKTVETKEGKVITQKRKKRNELSKSFVKNMNRFEGQRQIQFD